MYSDKYSKKDNHFEEQIQHHGHPLWMNEMAADKGGFGSQMQLNYHKISYRFSKV